MLIKPLRDLAWVELVEEQPEPDSPGILAQVLAAGPDLKGIKAGDVVYLSPYLGIGPVPSWQNAQPVSKKRMVSAWDIQAKVAD